MDSYFLKIMFSILLVCFLHTAISILGLNSPSQSSHVKCIEKERQALLNFKHGIINDSGMLSTWRDGDNRDCCKWKGVQCNNETGHVYMLDLHGQYTQRLSGVINISSLIDLQNIEHLNLSHNNFQGSHIPKLMDLFTNLRYLDLSRSWFDGRIPYELGNLSKLEYLDLKYNFLAGAIPSQLGKLTSLRHLDLSMNSLGGEIPSEVGKLTSLLYLDLSFVSLCGGIPSEVGKLKSLRYLDLSYNFLRGEIPYDFQNLSQLQYLDLLGVNLSGPIPFQIGNLPILHTLRLKGNFDLKINDAQWLSSLSSLTTLDLYSLNLGYSHHWLQTISELIPNLRELRLVHCSLTDKSFLVPSASIKNYSSSLVTLDLSYNLLKSSAIFHWIFNFTTNLNSLSLDGNLLDGLIPDGFGNICTLQKLFLNNNNLSGEISSFIQNSSWCNRYVFQTLDLSYNWFSGMIPNLSIFTSLKELDLSNNQLTGEIPKSIGLLFELVSLYLEENYLEGDINELHLTNLSKLMELDLTDNSLSLKFSTTWVPPFQLFRLGLASWKMGPSFPSWLQTQSDLSFLDISDAGIDDFVPDWFWNKLQSISQMNMSHNSLKGTIPNLPIKVPKGYTLIILNSNKLEGEIPAFLSQAYTLDFSNNQISGLNTFLCGKRATTNLRTLDLSNNQIMGQLPNCWEHLNSLEFLDLSNNKLSGKIPQSMGTLVNLEALVLRHNSLIGDLPFALKNCTRLDILEFSENLLSGPIPSWIGESLQQLKILSLRANRFFGSVPLHLCYLRQIHLMDLSRNNLLGVIPTCLSNFTAMKETRVIAGKIVRRQRISTQRYYLNTYVSNVLLTWKGQDYVYWNPEILLKSIDFSSNDLIGEIPKEVGNLLGLVSLNLSRNNLHGEIPSEIGNLNSLDFLDLSRNHFSGKIPSTLSQIDRLAKLDLSNNNLIGRIPWGRQLQTFDASSFEGNLGLCGQQLNKSCPGDEATLKPQGAAIDGEDDNSIFYEALYMSLGLGFFTGFWGLIGSILLWQPWRNAYLSFLNRLIDFIFVMVDMNIAKCCRWLKG